MDVSYRRVPTSLLERTLARHLKRCRISAESAARLDLVHNVDVAFRRA